MTERDNGLSIAGLTDDLVGRLPEPYGLLVELTRYVPLNEILSRSLLAAYLITEEPEGVYLCWQSIYLIPKTLYDKLIQYQEEIEGLRWELDPGPHRSALFTTLACPVTEETFFRTVAESL